MIGHLSLGVSDMQRAMAFYDAVLACIGATRVWSDLRAAGYGPTGGNDKLALFAQPGDLHAGPLAAGPGFHLALDAPDRASVDAFHAAALANGGQDEGPPGPRTHYGDSYYAAFVRDPDGHKLEVVHQ